MDGTESFAVENYGGRRDRLRHHFYATADRLGLLHAWRDIEWRRVQRLVMVCKGNICRSPYAEARARLLGLPALSCGLHCGAGAPATETAIECARQRHVDLRLHRSVPLHATRIVAGDLLVAMEPAQARRLAPTATRTGAQVTLLGLWGARSRPCIADPYGLDHRSFHTCYSFIDASLVGLHDLMRTTARAP